MLRLLVDVITQDEGQDLMEYALLASLLAIVLILSVTSFGQEINTLLWQPIAANV